MSIDRGMDKKDVISIYAVEYYSAIKRNKFKSVLVKWMNLEPVIWPDRISHEAAVKLVSRGQGPLKA